MTITHRTQSNTGTQRDAWVEVNLNALERNYKKIKDIVQTDIMAVLKADAYGHGATAIAPVLQSLGVSSFGVATVDEGVALRNCGIRIPILILGATPFWTYETCIENNLTITIYSEEQLDKLEEFCKKENEKTSIELKIDTGMNRLGINPDDTENVLKKILLSKHLKLTGIFSHLSSAQDKNFSKLQKEKFDNALLSCKNLESVKIKKHLGNSYAGINYSDFRYDAVRIGIGLYGQEFNFLEPLISVKGRITRIYEIKKGEYVSYDRTWKAEKDSVIATVPIGYADGIDRKLSNNFFASYKNKQIKQVGTITMDQMMFDISEIKDAKINDIIILIGKENPISTWAEVLGTITYELICRLKLRLPRVYIRE